MKPETQLQNLLLKRAPFRIPELRLFRRQVAVFKVDDRTVRVGIKGQCDLYGYLRGGHAVEIELKSATGTLSKEQKDWRAFCLEWGIPYVLLQQRAGESHEETVERWGVELAKALT